jgi:hypothetical protein
MSRMRCKMDGEVSKIDYVFSGMEIKRDWP